MLTDLDYYSALTPSFEAMLAQEQMQSDKNATMASQAGNMSNQFGTTRYGYSPAIYGPTINQGKQQTVGLPSQGFGNTDHSSGYPNFASALQSIKSGSNGQNNYDATRAPFNTNPLLVLNNGQAFPNIGMGAAYPQQQTPSGDPSGVSNYLASGMFPPFVGSTNVVAAGLPAYSWPYSINGTTPGLVDNRRSSWSSNEDMMPPTPITGHADYWTPIDRSGHMGLPYLASSPPALTQAYMPGNPFQHMKCSDNNSYELVNLDALTSQAPAIPRAVPAMWSNQADLTLAKCLQNTEGITNVYIRGFLPDTSDDDLRGYAARFGEIESHKAIIDMETGKCKG